MTISIYDYRDFLRGYRSGSDERVTEDREHFGVCRVFRDWLRRMEAVNPEAAWSYMEDRFQARLGWSLDDGCYPFGYPPATGAHLIPARAAFVEAEWEWAREMCAGRPHNRLPPHPKGDEMIAELTKEEAAWVRKLQKVLNQCPSTRIGFYTVGDPSVSLYDTAFNQQIDDLQNAHPIEFGQAVADLDADLGNVIFPNNVCSTCG
jgi:hypothetical protein